MHTPKGPRVHSSGGSGRTAVCMRHRFRIKRSYSCNVRCAACWVAPSFSLATHAALAVKNCGNSVAWLFFLVLQPLSLQISHLTEHCSGNCLRTTGATCREIYQDLNKPCSRIPSISLHSMSHVFRIGATMHV